MKIISGKIKGQSILIHKNSEFRPTLSRIREDLFNIINHNKILNIKLEESIFCDLFCGSGSIGLEAISRGAKKVIFNDIDTVNIQIIRKFLVNTEFKNYLLKNEDAYIKSELVLENSDIIYIDPPYKDKVHLFMQNIYKEIPLNCLIIIETDQKFEHQNLIFQKKYKSKNLFFLKKTNEI